MKKRIWDILLGFLIGSFLIMSLVYIFRYDDIKVGVKIKRIMDIVDNYYYEDISDTKEERMENIYSGAMNGLDSYSSYMSESGLKELVDGFNMNLCGIGVRTKYVEADSNYYIADILEGSPAEKAGLKVGDIIYKVGDKVAKELLSSELSEIIRGDRGTTVDITVVRGDKKLVLTVTRDDVHFPNVETKIYDNIGYINIYTFGDSTSDELSVALNEMRSNKVDSIIIDLRQNSGGDVSSAIDCLSQLVPSCVVYSEKYRDGTTEEFSCESDLKELEFKYVILTSHYTASSAEIFSGVFKDYGYGTLIGERTFGKGCVQSVLELGDGSAIKITIAEWLTAKGNEVLGIGIFPDIYVRDDFKNDDYLHLDDANDCILSYALDWIRKGDK